ncbi:hypothetical protein FQA39_LY00003 [Lamprigera yunnana]|nr:hypothetical protein FQA39_LY00003 [Lamprigera yunnana]
MGKKNSMSKDKRVKRKLEREKDIIWYVRSLTGKEKELEEKFDKVGLDILGMTEIKRNQRDGVWHNITEEFKWYKEPRTVDQVRTKYYNLKKETRRYFTKRGQNLYRTEGRLIDDNVRVVIQKLYEKIKVVINLTVVGIESSLGEVIICLYKKRVCASHFSCKHFTNSLKNRLIQGAVPLHYNTKENADKQLNISTETLNLKREAVPKVYKQSRVAEDPIPSAASPLSEINDDIASELNKSPTLLQVVGVCDIFSFGLALYLTQTLYRVSRNEGAKRKSQLVDIILCRFNPNYLSPKMLLKRAGAPYR